MKRPKLKLVSSQPYNQQDRVKQMLERAQKACATDDWEKAFLLYDEAQRAIMGSPQHQSSRGEMHVYMAYCLLFLGRAEEAGGCMNRGLDLIADENRRATVAREFAAKSQQVMRGK